MLQQSTSPLRASALVLTIAVALVGVVPYRVTAQAAQTTSPAPASVSAALAVSGSAATPVNTTALQTIAASRIVPASPAAHALSKALPAQVEAADSAAPAAALAFASAALAVPVPVPMSMPMPMPMETPITKTSSQTMAASRIVPAPPAAPAPPKAPSAPSAARAAAPAVPPAPPLVSEGSWTHGNSDYAHVLIDGNTTNAVGNTDDLRAAKSQQRNGEALLWVRKGGSKYVVRDPATLQRLKAAYAPVAKFGKEQGQLGAKQGELGAQQGELGARQGQIGAQQGELAARYAEAVMRSVGADADARSKAEAAAAEKRLEALGQQQDQLGREQHALGSKQEEIGRQQQALGERQRLASEAAQREADRLIDAAIANGLAQRLQ